MLPESLSKDTDSFPFTETKYLTTLTAINSNHSSSSSWIKQIKITTSSLSVSVTHVSKSWITSQTNITINQSDESSLSTSDLLLPLNHPSKSDTTEVILIAVFVPLSLITMIVMLVLGCIYKHRQNVKFKNAHNATMTPIPR